MTFEYRYEPLDRWPQPDTERREPAPFKARYTDTLELLGREMRGVQATGAVVVQMVLAGGRSAIRLDGLPRTTAKALHPGVRLSFTCRHGDLTYATDRFTSRWSDGEDWHENLRAIALGLEGLRKIDRYGITKTGEQYRGWRQIEDGGAGAAGLAAVLTGAAGLVYDPAAPAEQRDKVYRRALAGASPDRWAGDRTRWDAVEQAGRHFGHAKPVTPAVPL